MIPSVVVTNDWFTALIPAYNRSGAFGEVFRGTKFLHIFHNLQEAYEGRLWPLPQEGTLEYIHQLDPDYLVDPYIRPVVVNPSRCAIKASDQWATVSPSYLREILDTSPLAYLLKMHPKPFAFPNGIPVEARVKKLRDQAGTDHFAAKLKLQQKYFKFQELDDSIPVFAFVGRIVAQKGVHLIYEAAEHLITKYGGKLQIIVGGPANRKDPYAARCAVELENLSKRFPGSFWSAPNEFFMDGSIVNLGADFGMMPSAFEPGGIVQHEFFVGGTPVIAFKTGGLKDSVFEFKWDTNKGNGFLLENHSRGDFIYAVERAIGTFIKKDKYKILRENAFKSTMDGATVTKAWCKEFYRLKNKFFSESCGEAEEAKIPKDWNFEKFNDSYVDEYIYRNFVATSDSAKALDHEVKFEPLTEIIKRQSETVPTTFQFNMGNRRVGCVLITGEFDGWKSKQKLNYDYSTNTWYLTLNLKKGKYLYQNSVINCL